MNSYVIHMMIMAFGVLISGVSQILLKKAAEQEYSAWIWQYLNARVIVGYGIFVLATLCTVIAYRVIPVSLAPIWDALGQLVVIALSAFVLKEKIRLRKRVGMAVIVVGILIFFL